MKQSPWWAKNRSGWKKRDYSRQFFPPLLSLEIDLRSSGMRGGMVNEASQVALLVKNPPSNAGGVKDSGPIPGSGRSPGGGLAIHSSILVWRIRWTEEPGGLYSPWGQGVGHT